MDGIAEDVGTRPLLPITISVFRPVIPAHVHTCACTFAYLHVHVCVSALMYVIVNIYVCVCVCVVLASLCEHMHACIYVSVYI
jgi:hypothetical protein